MHYCFETSENAPNIKNTRNKNWSFFVFIFKKKERETFTRENRIKKNEIERFPNSSSA